MIDARGALTRIPEIFGEAFRIPEASGQIGRVALPPTPDRRSAGRSPSGPTSSTRWTTSTTPSTSTGSRKAVLAAAAAAGESPRPRRDPRRYRLEYAARPTPGWTCRTLHGAEDDGGWSYRVTAADGPELFRAAIDLIGGDR